MSFKNQSKFDGLPVELYEGKFSGSFELEDDIGEQIAYDDVVTFLVVGVAGKVNIGSTRGGDLKRTNTFNLANVQVVPVDMARAVFDELQFDRDLAERMAEPDSEDVDMPIDVDMSIDVPVVDVESETQIVSVAGGKDSELTDFLYGDANV